MRIEYQDEGFIKKHWRKDEKNIPDYYNKFHCIADQCKDSCCIGWEIMIDPDSYEKYKREDESFMIV